MRNLLLIGFTSLLFFGIGCSTARTKRSDPVMRVMVDPASIDERDYHRIIKALVQSGKWEVVGRGADFKAAVIEQNRQHHIARDRFAAKDKYAHLAKLYGAGGIVVANSQCELRTVFLGRSMYQRCEQFLSIVDANTAEIIASVEGEATGPSVDRGRPLTPSWDETVYQLNESFPSHFESKDYHDRLVKYREESARRAQ